MFPHQADFEGTLRPSEQVLLKVPGVRVGVARGLFRRKCHPPQAHGQPRGLLEEVEQDVHAGGFSGNHGQCGLQLCPRSNVVGGLIMLSTLLLRDWVATNSV